MQLTSPTKFKENRLKLFYGPTNSLKKVDSVEWHFC